LPSRNTILQLSITYIDPVPSNSYSKFYLFIISGFVDHMTILFMLIQKSYGDGSVVIEIMLANDQQFLSIS